MVIDSDEPLIAAEQSHDVMSTVAVSNTGQSGESDRAIQGDSSIYMTSFTTGPVRHRLHKIQISASVDDSATGAVQVGIYDNYSSPRKLLQTLATADTPGTSISQLEYTSDGFVLLANTRYWVGVSVTGGNGKLRLVPSNDEDAGAAEHWEIGDNLQQGNDESSPHSIKMAVYTVEDPGDTLVVSNTRQANRNQEIADGNALATTFTTGAQDHYLRRVRLILGGPGTAEYSISVRADNSGRPGDVLTSLSTTGAEAPANVELSANTTYWVSIEATGSGGGTKLVTTNDEDPGKAAGWSIGDNTWRRSGSTWSQLNLHSLQMAIFAEEIPELTAVQVTSSPLDGDTYKAGENIEVQFIFDGPVRYVKGVAALFLGDGAEHYRGRPVRGRKRHHRPALQLPGQGWRRR